MSCPRIDPGIYPFWFWNGLETEAEIDRQLHLAKNGGFRGMAIHSRTGNRIPYLSPTWFSLVRHACRTASRLDLKIWLYDEDGYPSGTAGNLVQTTHPELRQQYLTFRYARADQCKEETVACFEPTAFHRIEPSTVSGDTDVLMFDRCRLNQYVDTLNPLTAPLFLDLTHERYYRELTEFFGNTIECIYTDDVNSKMILASGLPWTDSIDEEFRRQYGESLIELLPWLVESLPGAGVVRIRYRRLIQQLFLDNFIRPMAEWCVNHQVVFTGHLSGDEGPLTRTVNEIGSVMPFQLSEDIPGIDDYLTVMDDGRYLSRIKNHLGLYPVPLFKSGASIAHQFRHGLFSCECLAGLGWSYTMERQDRQMLFELAMGVNIITPHAAYYSIGGPGKKDHPPSYFFQQPYWPQWAGMATKWTRIATLLQRGRFMADTLVFYPSSSAWAVQNGNHIIPDFPLRLPTPEMTSSGIEEALSTIALELLRLKIGFDFADEFILADKGCLVKGGIIRLGEMSYHTVIIPPAVNFASGIVELLAEFLDSGGTVINLSGMAATSDGEPVSPGQFGPGGRLEKAITVTGGWHTVLASRLIPDVSMMSPDGDDLAEIMIHARIGEEGRELFLLNLSHTDKTIAINPGDSFVIYDPLDDEVIWSDVYWPADFMLPAWDCCHVLPRAFAIGKRHNQLSRSRFVNRHDFGDIPLYVSGIELEQDNVAILSSRLENKTYFESVAADHVRIKKILAENSDFQYVYLNGKRLLSGPVSAHPCDPCYRGIDLDQNLPPGRNRFEMTSPTGLVYLTGDFLVTYDDDGMMLCPGTEQRFETGDLSRQGLPFYWGAVVYEISQTLELTAREIWLDLGTVCGVVEIVVNDRQVGVLSSGSYRLDVTPFLNVGHNIFRIRLWNTAQNFINPFSDGKFAPAPFGLYGPVKLLIGNKIIENVVEDSLNVVEDSLLVR